jgi:hypothetical protein
MLSNNVLSQMSKRFSENKMSLNLEKTNVINVRFEVLTAVTMKNGVFWVVTPCGSCKSRRFGGT